MQIDEEELRTRFTYYRPKEGQPARYERIRGVAHAFAKVIVEETPPSREQSLALTKLEEAVMHANAAIARRE